MISEVKAQSDEVISDEVKCKGRTMAPGSAAAAARATTASSHVCNCS